jgi:DNA-binding CsgD family transcriptional regulator
VSEIDRADRRRIAELCEVLDTLRVDGVDVVQTLLPSVRSLLDVETLLFYAPRENLEGWRCELLEVADFPDPVAFTTRFRRYLATAPRRFALYDPIRPEPDQRNRVLESVRHNDRTKPGMWIQSAIYREVFEPLGMHQHRQLRALLCEGPSLLGWFGALHRGPPPRRAARLLGEFVPALRRHLALRRQLRGAPVYEGALATTLEHIGARAVMLDRHGALLHANGAARAWLEEDRRGARAILHAAITGTGPSGVEATPLASPGHPPSWLVLVRGTTGVDRIDQRCDAAASRWQATPRQREVLKLVARGLANTTIAAALRISERAVELHVTALLDRAGVDGRAALVALVLSAP